MKTSWITYIRKVDAWKAKYLSERNFVLLVALFVGLSSGLAAVLLKNMIFYFSRYVINLFAADSQNFLFLILPLIGVTLSFLYVRYIIKDDISHGVSRVLYAISTTKSLLKRSKMYSSIIASTITIGFGGSVGPEAPVVLTGAAIGSNIGKRLRVGYKTMTLLIACGSAGAVAGIFGAPIAGFVFAIEVLMIDLTMGSMLPLLVSSLSGAVVSALLTGRSALFHFDVSVDFEMQNLPFYLLLGLAAGFVSHYFLYMTGSIEKLFEKVSKQSTKILIGGGLLCVLIFIFPPLYGEGLNFLSGIFYGDTSDLMNNTFLYDYREIPIVFLAYILLVMFIKVIAMALTNGSGGIGGVFAPSMFVGAFLGLFVSRTLNICFPSLAIQEANFALTGMAAVMAGVMHAPLTAIFLVAEITGGYKLFIPLILVSVSAYAVNMYFNPHSIYTKKLAEKGNLFTHNKDSVVLSMLTIQRLIETNFAVLKPEDTLGTLIKAIGLSPRNIFPVVEHDGRYVGVVFLDEVKPLIFRSELYDKIKISDIMFLTKEHADVMDNMEKVAQKFLNIPDYNIPVLDGDKYVGFLSRANVFSSYRKKVKELSND